MPNVSLMLNDNGLASYVSGSGSTTLVFQYTVAAGENTNDLISLVAVIVEVLTQSSGFG
jgi:hypothetical protein